MSVSGWVSELSDERRAWANTNNTVTSLDSVEPLVSKNLVDNVSSNDFANRRVVEADFIQSDKTVSRETTESQKLEGTDDLTTVIG